MTTVVLVAGIVVMILMCSGMFLLTPRGTVPVHAEGDDGQGSNLSPVASEPIAAER